MTLTFCPGLRFCTPIFAPVCEGLGTIVTAFLVGVGVGFGVGFGLAVANFERSEIVTLTF